MEVKSMQKMKTIYRREGLEQKINELQAKLSEIRRNCSHPVIIMFQCSNYYWVKANCLICGEKLETGYVLDKKEESVVNADIKMLISDECKYKIVKEKYERMLKENPDWTNRKIVKAINDELNKEEKAYEELKSSTK